MKNFLIALTLLSAFSVFANANIIECKGEIKTRNGSQYLYTFTYDLSSDYGLWEESVVDRILLSTELGCKRHNGGHFLCEKEDGVKYKKIHVRNIGFGVYQAKFHDETSVGGGWADILYPKSLGCRFIAPL